MRYFIIAGEASGDLHGSNLMAQLKATDPEAEFRFLGGNKMKSVGGDPVVHCSKMAYMGFVNVMKNLRKILAIEKKAQKSCIEFNPHKIILIDYPSFNLRFAKFARKAKLNAEVIYYISPKLWAWKSWRIRKIKKYVHRMFTIFPFETEYYRKRGYDVTYVGNPSVDSVNDFTKHFPPQRNNIFKIVNDNRPIIALLPGSRRHEIKSCLPKMCQLTQMYRNFQFVIAAAPSIESSFYDKIISDTETDKKQIKIIYNNTYKILQLSSAAVVNSGTATLETALFEIPQMVVYNVPGGKFTMLLKRIFIKTKYISLVNILAGKEVVKELIGPLFTKENMQKEMHNLLKDKEYISAIQSEYNRISTILGPPGAAKRLAENIVNNSEETNSTSPRS